MPSRVRGFQEPAVMMMPVRARWRALPRALRWPLLALITLYAGYVLLGNLLLNTPLGPAALNRSPDKFAMQSGPGLTWWPGRLVLWNVDLQGQSTRTNWKVSAQRMSGRIRLLPLLHCQLLVPELHARGVHGGMRAAVVAATQSPAATQARRAAVAPVKDAADMPAASASEGTATATRNVEKTATQPPAQHPRATTATNATPTASTS
ncbi:hypothetical protein DXO181_10635 [Xanthomonas oryzae pv. oryzae]|uniref:Uncharacterized protein n=1 Tax=Xanthomonas oryzae pv. oryzae (strain KACC10331 / KXO85) TaxID=291331 RepID=Q5GUU0_XANOR|nr:conserved hypothetical protein [Xanthomonas oryzae pv. oryzae KACC 10331]AOS04140.1 hypothetical protein ATY42_20855 [Xanthomonas oryzae pv. oryzae]AOS24932.1 hypothetical protein ATY47_21075 [Xanthomonas oryzae pv. oryzae]AOS33240.1 hypothetical protein ATY49_20950 [Xanthomonas oryzae pv. oryzae]OLH69097.1 hypothetical protein DXO181_10635 [Xanthomonas oryzae pv. oryzae]